MSARTDAWFYFRAKDAGLSSGLNRMGNNVDRFSKRSKRNVRDLGLELGRLNSRMMSLGRNLPGVGLLSGAGMFYGAKKAIDEFAERESIQVAIEYISGNQDEAARNLGFLKSVTNEMGLAYNATAEGFKVFTGSMIGGKYTMEEQRSMFTKISTAVRVLGLDAQRTESIFRAFSEMLSKGKMQAQELRVQLANALPGTMSLLATSMGKTRAEVEKMLSAGEITTDKYFAAFLNALYERYEPGLERAKKKTVAQLARISNSWDSAWVNMGDAIAQAGVLSHINSILMSTDMWIQSNKELIGQNVKGVVDTLVGGLGFVKDNWQEIKKGFLGIALGIGVLGTASATASIITTLSNPIFLAAAGVAALSAAVGYALVDLKQLQDANYSDAEGKLKKMSAWSQFIGGAASVGGFAVKAIGNSFLSGGSIDGNRPFSPDVSNVGTGFEMIGGSIAQGFAEGFKTSKNKSISNWGYRKSELWGKMGSRLYSGMDANAERPINEQSIEKNDPIWKIGSNESKISNESMIKFADVVSAALQRKKVDVDQGNSPMPTEYGSPIKFKSTQDD